jgi:Putative Ig domain
MAVSKFTSSSNANDFNINIASTYSTATLDREYPSGSYSIVSSVNDTTLDIYAFNSLGTLVGYTGTKAFTATGGFSKLVVIGGTVGDILGFSYKTTFTTASATAETGAGPVLLGASPTGLANVNSSLTLTGYNFASGMSVTFTGSDSVAIPAKSVVVGSATSAIVTRPDTFLPSLAPYTVSAYNPGVNTPVGTNSYILASPTITVGAVPVWVTPVALPAAYYNTAYALTLSATDADSGSSVTYSYGSGNLPAGLSFNASTGVISGTPTSTSYSTFSYTVLATDTGLNTVSRTFSLKVNPTLGGTITSDATYVYQTFLASSATLTVNQAITADYLIVAGGGGGATDIDVGGGGGGGGLLTGSTSLSATTYSIAVGAGGSRGSGPDNTGVGGGGNGGQGGNSTFNGLTAIGGGGGGTREQAGGSGGSGGGGGDNSKPGGAGTSGQGYAGGTGPGMNTQSGNDSGGGGGAGGAASFNIPGPGLYSAIGLGTFAAGGRGAQLTGAITSTDGTGNGGSGARNGASGIVVIRYTRSQVGS